MPKVYGVHEVELRPGVDPAEFERYVTQEFAADEMPGWSTRLLRGDRGSRAGRYLVLFEIDDIEARDTYFTGVDEQTQAFADYLAASPRAAAAWQRQDEFVESDSATDYVLVGD